MINPSKRLLDESLDFSKTIRSQLTARLVAKTLKLPSDLISKRLKILSFKLEKLPLAQRRGVANSLKKWEAHIMLPGFNPEPMCCCPFRRFIFRGLKRYDPNKVRAFQLTLLGVHRGLLDSSNPKTKTITTRCDTLKIKTFIEKHRGVLTNKTFVSFLQPKLYSEVFHKYTMVSKSGRQYNRNAFNPYSMDPTVDSNNRTSGRTFPVRISFKGCANGKACSSQMLDLIALSARPDIVSAINHVNREASGSDVPLFLLDGTFQGSETSKASKAKMFSATSKGGESDKYFGFPDHWKIDVNEYLSRVGKTPILSRLHIIESPSAKSRVIAIFDSLSQCSLKHFHNVLETSVRKIPTDFTFDQPASFSYLHSIKNGSDFHSTDISAATDTIPFAFSRFILEQILCPKVVKDPRNYVNSVSTILTKRPFRFNGKDLFYGTGQPMGSYGSFLLLSLTQHTLVQLAYRIAYPSSRWRFFRHYAVVGDDIVIKEDKVASCYLEILSDLNIPINSAKSMRSKHAFEFCKKTFSDGVSQGAISLKGIAASGYLVEPGLFYELFVDRPFPFCYSVMCELFSKKKVVLWLKLSPKVRLKDQPESLSQIPSEVTNHAVRTHEIAKILSTEENPVISVDNARPADTYHGIDGNVLLSPWVNRMNYSAVIADVFRSYHRRAYDVDLEKPLGKVWPKIKGKVTKVAPNDSYKLCPWIVALAAGANSFYLSYLDTYHSDRERSPFRLSKDIGKRRREIYRSCLLYHQFWDSSDKLRLYSIDPENLRSLKMRS